MDRLSSNMQCKVIVLMTISYFSITFKYRCEIKFSHLQLVAENLLDPSISYPPTEIVLLGLPYILLCIKLDDMYRYIRTILLTPRYQC